MVILKCGKDLHEVSSKTILLCFTRKNMGLEQHDGALIMDFHFLGGEVFRIIITNFVFYIYSE